MKKLLLIFALAGTVSAQEYLLPIGKNVNSRAAKVVLAIGGGRNSAIFSYTPAMGDLQTIIIARLRELADSFTPIPGLEDETYGLFAEVSPGPYVSVEFTPININGRWIVPPEVLEVKLHYGTSWIYPVDGAKEIRMRLFKNGQQIASFSTANPNESYGFNLSPCSIGATQDAFARDEARVSSKYTVPSLWDGTWDYGEMDIVAERGYATVNLLNGFIIQYSSVEFLRSLNALEIPQAPVLTLSATRISHIARVGHTTELTISAEASGNAHLEFAEAIGGNWSAVPAYPVPLALKAGSSTFTHTTDAPTSFYRLRIVKTEGQ